MGARPTVSGPNISAAAVELERLNTRPARKGTLPNNICVKVSNGDATSSDGNAPCAEPLPRKQTVKGQPELASASPTAPTAAAAKRKATTSAETLRSEEDTTARIIQTVNASVAEALRTTVHATVADAVRAAVIESFASVDSRLTNMETRLANMETTVNNTVAGLEALRTASDTSFAHGQHNSRHTQPSVLSLFSPAQRTHNALKGFRKKKDHLQLLVQETRLPNNQTPPDVIALQETTAVVSLPGYIAYQQFTDQHNQEAPSTGTLVHKSLTAKQHDLEFPDIPHTVVEILPRKRSHQPLFVLNVYCAPRARADDFHLLFGKTTSLAGGAQLLILGDLNARHPDWCYPQANKRGKKLWQLSQDLRLTLLNDPQQSPTRIGNSVCRDTSPDVAYCKNIAQARWENTCQLGSSDHYIIAVQLQTSAGKKVANAIARITEWPKFREVRESEALDSITSLKEWTTSLNDHV
ncbi:hypothetical protein HPB52_003227 [Rhipicephalus sanguineus]|uniref:Endonuclease/exonuclease/phosphatase domain-containing protein n=1 Tax=Rhipicephalus sanguineus TaxID=34632 RepID=A0A9D4PPW9_RHISA|nr:hypothetical protein HPB52_003227 [Rhipicephalus sanguineus]